MIKYTFQKKLFFAYSLIVFILLTISISAFYSYTYLSFKTKANENLTQLMSKTADQMDNIILNMDRITLQLIYNEDFRNTMSQANAEPIEFNYFDTNLDESRKLLRLVTSINTMNPIVSRISVIGINGDWVTFGRSSRFLSKNQVKDLDFIEPVISQDGKQLSFPVHMDMFSSNENIMVFSVCRSIKYDRSFFGVIEVQQNADLLDSVCSVSEEIKVNIFDKDGRLVYPYKDLDPGEVESAGYLLDFINDKAPVNTSIVRNPADNNDEFASYKPLVNEWTLVFSEPANLIYKPIFELRNIIFLVWFLMIILTIGIIYILTKNMTSPIRKLRSLINNMDYKDLNMELDTGHENNEVNLLNTAFNEMLLQLKKYSNLTIEAKTREIKVHFQALQSQINPHFLYNTLAAISLAGQENGNFKVMQMCSQLSKMLRYISSSHQDITDILSEIDYVRDYLDLLKSRMEHNLQYEINIPDNMNKIKIPKLLIQPLVENSITHGFNNTRPPWKIKITGECDSAFWHINVTDNGSGFTGDALKIINEQKVKYKENINKGLISSDLQSEGLGILNTFARLYIFYGDSAYLDIVNLPEGGCSIDIGGLINLSLYKEVADDDQTDACR